MKILHVEILHLKSTFYFFTVAAGPGLQASVTQQRQPAAEEWEKLIGMNIEEDAKAGRSSSWATDT